MVNPISIRNKIEEKVFAGLGSTALYSALTEGSSNIYGDRTDTYATGTSITIVPWGLMHKEQEYFQFGDLDKGEMDVAIKYNQDLNIDDKITYNSKVYKVKAIEHYIIKDTIIVKVARLREQI